jgi:hypothetical protein
VVNQGPALSSAPWTSCVRNDGGPDGEIGIITFSWYADLGSPADPGKEHPGPGATFRIKKLITREPLEYELGSVKIPGEEVVWSGVRDLRMQRYEGPSNLTMQATRGTDCKSVEMCPISTK